MAFYMPKGKRKTIGLLAVLVSSLLLTGVALGSWAEKTQKEIAGGVLRLHVIANSDCAIDQTLKINVRDKILEECGYLFRDVASVRKATQRAESACGKIKVVAERELRRQGFFYPVTVKVEENYFPTKDYGGVRLPAGKYQALQVKIGSYAGQNWWCVLYPPLCLTEGSVKADDKTQDLLRKELSAQEYALITQTENMEIRTKFYLLEIIGKYFSDKS